MMQYTVPAPTDGLVTLPVGTLLAALATIPDPRRTHGSAIRSPASLRW